MPCEFVGRERPCYRFAIGYDVVLPIVAEVLRIAGRAQIAADIADPVEQRHHRRRGRVVGVGVSARGLVMRHRRSALRNPRPVVLEEDRIADAGRSRRGVAVAVGPRHYLQQCAVGDPRSSLIEVSSDQAVRIRMRALLLLSG